MSMQTLSDREAGRAPASAPAEAVPVKPLLRGVSHQIAFFVALVVTAVLVLECRTRAGATATFVFGSSLFLLFGTSALYHRVHWSNVARARMRRLDHAAIFLLIAGGYTPLFTLAPGANGGRGALVAIWIAGGVGIVKSLVWPHAPKWFTALLAVAIGWMVIGEVIGRTARVGSTSVGLLCAAGATYSVGAVVYALKRPDPWPRTFGYHEIFHLLTILASAMLVAHVALVVRATGG
ncbi:MAG: putative rane protein hemolysin [Labilithrix sp.]|nr:putative rane protein hemolysin [Labilithrix sp.]